MTRVNLLRCLHQMLGYSDRSEIAHAEDDSPKRLLNNKKTRMKHFEQWGEYSVPTNCSQMTELLEHFKSNKSVRFNGKDLPRKA